MSFQPTETVTQIERAVLGACMLDETAIWKVTPLIDSGSFTSDAHSLIYRAILSLRDKRLSTDALSVCDWVEQHGGLDKVGGAEYVKGLPSSSENIETHAKALVDIAGNRRLMELAMSMAGVLRDGSFDDNYARLQSELLKIAPKNATPFRDSESLAADAILDIRLRVDEPTDCAGLVTGYQDFDRKFSGLLSGLHVIQGRTSSGKTWLALGLAEGAAANGARVAFISLELTDKFVTLRRISR